MTHEVKILPSLLSSNFANLQLDIRKCEQGGADMLHLDVMDGHFVPNITFGPIVVNAVSDVSELPLDVHLMISDPDKFSPIFAEAGADYISIHAEATHHLHRSLMLIKECGSRAGIALNPVTPLEHIYDAVEYADFVLLMSVNPGFGGQSFINNFYRRSEKLKNFLIDNDLSHVEIEVDGGIKAENARDAVLSGASMLVSGSGIFSGDIEQNIKKIRSRI